MSEHFLDARRLLCPLPVIRVQNKILTLNANDILHVTATDPGTKQDIPSWCRMNGHTVLSITENAGEITITIRAATVRGP